MMKKIILFIFLSFALVGCGLGYEPTTTEPIVIDTDTYLEINNLEDLKNMEMNKSYILMADLDLSSEEWTPIGSFTDPFLGNFDGNNHSISNLTISEYNQDFNGLFGYIKGDVFDLELIDFSISYETEYLTYAGGLAGALTGDVTNVSTTGEIDVINTKSNTFAGLLTGFSQAELDNVTDITNFAANVISDVHVDGSIEVDTLTIAFVGGFIGKTYNTSIHSSSADVVLNVKTEQQRAYVGGFIGHNYGGILVGFESQIEDTNINIFNNIALSDITVESLTKNIHVGGFIGYNNYGTVYNNFADTSLETTGTLVSVALFIGEDWAGNVTNNLAIGEALVNAPTTLLLDSPIIGASYSPIDITSNYYLSNSFSTIRDTDSLITQTDLTSNAFYLTTLSWDQEFINQVLDKIE